MMRSDRSWEELLREARNIEKSIENKLYELSNLNKLLSIKNVPDTRYDEENPNVSNDQTDEKEIISEIDNLLRSISETMDQMKYYNNENLNIAQDALLKRYREVYFDFNTEFKRTCSSIQEKKESVRLFSKSSRRRKGSAEDTDTDHLIQEKSFIDSSRSIAASVIGQAIATKNSLLSQRNILTGSKSKVSGLSSTFAGINSLVDQIKDKKLRNNTILALVIAACICFTIWWTVLSKI